MPSDPAFPRAGQPGTGQQDSTPPEPPVEEPRTEQTLTTRIRINIPGSRPIPPVVVRSPMPGAEGAAEGEDGAAGAAQEPPVPTGPRHRSGSGSSPVIGVMDSANGSGAMPDLPPEWRTDSTGGPADATAAAAGTAGASDATGGDGGESPSTWFAPRRKSQSPAAAPTPTPGEQDRSTGTRGPTPPPTPPRTPLPYEQPAYEQPFEPPVYERPAFEQPGYEQPVYEPPPQQQPDYGRPVYQQQPYGLPEPDPQGPPAPPNPMEQQTPAVSQLPPPAPQNPMAPGRPTGGGRPPGMNGGLIVGGPDLPAPPDALDTTMPLAVFRDEPLQAQPQATPQAQPPTRNRPSPAPAPAPSPFQQPGQVPETGRPAPAPGSRGTFAPRPSPRGAAAASEASAQPPAGATGAGPGAPAQPLPATVGDGFAGGTGGAGAPPRKESGETQPAAAKASSAKKGKAASRGRKLLVTGVGLLVLLAGVTYGAGLMLNQADVPKGTTVLGHDIGGDTRDAAVHELDGTVGVDAAKPLQLVIGGKTVPLQTSVAGLTIDTTETVKGVAHHSYNPSVVIGSLFGGTHPVAPVVRIDDDKLRSALQTLAGNGSGSAKEGYVRFTDTGGVVTVPPQPGKALDVKTSIALVKQAYHERAAGLPDHPITLPVTSSQPKVSAAALSAAAKSLGAYAAANKFTVTVQGVSQLFGKITFSKALTLRPDASGKLVPVFDLAKLKDAYGTVFADAQVTHDGVLGPVTPQDVATALTKLITKADGSALTVTLT